MPSTEPAPDRRTLRHFGLILAAGIAGIGGVLWPWLHGAAPSPWPWAAAAVVALWALVSATTLGPLYRGWMALGAVLGGIVNGVLLGAVFYLMIVPIGLCLRGMGKDPLGLRRDPASRSCRKPSSPRPPDHMEKPF